MKKRYVISSLILVASITCGFSAWFINTGVSKTEDAGKKTEYEPPVAYIYENPTIKYTSIEKALEVAGSNDKKDTICVILNTNPTIKRNCIVHELDTLVIPYEYNTNGEPVYRYGEYTYGGSAKYSDLDIGRVSNSKFSDADQVSVDTYRKNNITIASGVNLTNNGKIYLGGVNGMGQDSKGDFALQPAGGVVNDYCQITLSGNAKITNYGTIDVYGYIKQDEQDAAYYNDDSAPPYIDNTSGTLIVPFVIYDYRGGTYSSQAVSQSVMPFSIYDMPSLQVRTLFSDKSKFEGKYMLTASSNLYTPANVSIMGGSDSLFLLGDGATAEIKYTPANHEYTILDHKEDPESPLEEEDVNKTVITAKEGAITLSNLEIELGGVTADTRNYFFPINYKFEIILESGSSISSSNKVKFLSGSKLHIKEDATATFDGNCVFYRTYVCQTTTGGSDLYPRELGAATLINDGTLNLNSSFGGLVETSASKGGDATIVTGGGFGDVVTSREVITATTSGLKVIVKCKEVTTYFGFLTDANTLKTTSKQKTITSSKGQQYWNNDSSEPFESTSIEFISGEITTECLIPSTLITMADGSKKEVKDIVAGDELLVFNHETGQLDSSPVIFNDSEPMNNVNVINLNFSNGKQVGVIYEHGFFDLSLGKYVYIDENNAMDYVGHEFYVADGGSARLNSVNIVEEYTECYSPVTAYHLNYFTEDMLSMPGGIEGFFNIFEYGKDLKYIDESKQADIALYGLFTYEDFKDILPYEVYCMFPASYLKVSIGKGYITWENILALIDRYQKFWI